MKKNKKKKKLEKKKNVDLRQKRIDFQPIKQ